MLDVVITDNRPLSAPYHDQCVASVHAAAKQAGFPVNVIVTPGNLRAIAQARLAGFDQGSARYVTFVPDFDYVLPRAFVSLTRAMEVGAPAIYGRELLQRGASKVRWHARHHLAVYRRDILHAVRDTYAAASVDEATALLQAAAAQAGDPADVPEWTYVRRVDPEVTTLFKGAR